MKTRTKSRPAGSIVGHAAELAEFATSGFGRRMLTQTAGVRAVVVGLEDGQEIPLHAPPLDLVITVVEGTGLVMAGDRAHWVRAGDVAVIPAGETRGLRAVGGRLIAVNVVSPPPADGHHEHAHEPWPGEEDAPDVARLILEEHAGLFPRVDGLRNLAAASATIGEPELRARLDETLLFLRDGLLPHAREEEISVYPAAERVLRAVGGATRTMSIDHRFIGEMVDELERAAQGPLSDPDRERIRRLLYGLEALLRVHFTKENEAYVPLLNRLSPAERRRLSDRLTGAEPADRHDDHDQED